MAHVEIDASAAPPRLLVDGMDIAMSVASDSVVVREEGGQWVVQLTLIPSSLRATLPDAVLEVEQGES